MPKSNQFMVADFFYWFIGYGTSCGRQSCFMERTK